MVKKELNTRAIGYALRALKSEWLTPADRFYSITYLTELMKVV